MADGNKFKMSNDPEWLKRQAAKGDDGECITAGDPELLRSMGYTWDEKNKDGRDENGWISRAGKNTTVGVSEFVKRQTEDSQFTDYRCSWSDLANRTVEEFEAGNYTKGYREGVFLVQMDKSEVPLFKTFDAYPMFEGMKLDAQWAKVPGREHEPAKLQVKILEPKIHCRYVDIVIYKKDKSLWKRFYVFDIPDNILNRSCPMHIMIKWRC